MEYTSHEDGSFTANINETIPLLFRGSELRRTNTGPHAYVEICLDGPSQTVLAGDEFNLKRGDPQIRLGNAAHKQLGDKEAVTAERIKRYLGDFCRGLWDAHIGDIKAVQLKGNRKSAGAGWVLRPYMVEGGITVLFGPPKIGKSWTAVGVAQTLNQGLSTIFGQAVKPRKTLYLNLERGEKSMEKRLGAINEALGLPEDTELGFINERGSTLLEVEEAVRREIRDSGYEALVFDGFSRAGMGSLLDDAVMNRICDVLNRFRLPVFAIAHTPREDHSHAFGSQMSSAAVDMELTWIGRKQKDGTIIGLLKGVTANDKPVPSDRLLAYEFYPEPDSDDEPDGLASIRPATRSEFEALDENQERAESASQKDLIEDYIRNRKLEPGEKPQTAWPSDIAQALEMDVSRVSKLLRDDDRFVKLPRDGRRQYYGLSADVGTYHGSTNQSPGNNVGSSTKVRTNQHSQGRNDVGTVGVEPPKGVHQLPTSTPDNLITCFLCERENIIPEKYGPKGEPICGGH